MSDFEKEIAKFLGVSLKKGRKTKKELEDEFKKAVLGRREIPEPTFKEAFLDC